MKSQWLGVTGMWFLPLWNTNITPLKLCQWKCKNAGNAYGHYHSSTFLLSKSQWLGVFGCVFPLYIEKTSSWLRQANEIWKIAHFQPRAGTIQLVSRHRPLSIFHRFSAGWHLPTKSQRSLDLVFPLFSSFFLTFCRLGPLIFWRLEKWYYFWLVFG